MLQKHLFAHNLFTEVGTTHRKLTLDYVIRIDPGALVSHDIIDGMSLWSSTEGNKSMS